MKLFLNKRSVILFGCLILFPFFNKNLFAQTCVSPLTPSYAWPTHSKWFFGEGVIGDFSGGTPSFSVLTGNTPPVTSYEGTASVTDEAGNLLWFTNGRRVWGPTGNLIHEDLTTGNEDDKDNGSSVQGVLITRHPLNPEVYHVFCTDDVISTANEGLDYFTLDKSGAVLSGPNTIQAGWSFEGLSATLHDNGIDVWVMSQESDNGNYNAYLIDCNGLNLAQSNLNQDMGIDFRGIKSYTRGALEFSWDGNKLAQGHPSAWPVGMQEVSLFDFDKSDGTLSNTLHFSSTLTTDEIYDIEFSNDNSKLYFTTKFAVVGVYDLNAGNAAAITASMDTVGILTTFWGGSESGIETAADGNIYINCIRESDLHVVNGNSLTPLSVGSDLKITLGLPNNYLPPQDWLKIQDPGALTDCDLPLDLETKWLCKEISAENTSGYENAYSVASSCTGCSIDTVTGVFNAPGPGTYKVYFEMCSIKDSITFTVGVCGCDADVSNSQPICVGETFLLDTSVISSSGTGVWTIDSVPSVPGDSAVINYSGSDTLFDASGANTKYGIYKLKYSIDATCFDSMYIEVKKTPTVVIDSIGPFCDDSVAVVMTAIPTNGGDVTGGWQINNGTPFLIPNFNTIALGSGTHNVKYGVDSLGCINSDSIDVLVKERPVLSIDSIGPFCADDSALTLTITPSVADTGVWSGAVSGMSNFDPVLLTPGDTTVMYRITGQCGVADTMSVVINPSRDATIITPRDTLVFCVMDPDPTLNVNEFGGSWNNTSVIINSTGSGYKIDLSLLVSSIPSDSVVKDTMLIYTWADPCGNSDTIWVTTTSKLNADISQPSSFCDTDSAINLIDSVANLGGKFSGLGITNDSLGTFDPSTSGPGTHVITYDIPGNCGDVKSVSIVVNATPNPEITNTDTVFCQNDSVIILTTAQSGGSWSELNDTYGALDTVKSEFKIDSSGTFKLKYGFSGQCAAYDTIPLEIIEMPTISFESIDTLCDDTSIVAISNTVAPSSSVLTWTGDGYATGKFDPNNNIGNNNIILTANNNGCIHFDTLKIYVLKRANAKIVPVPDFCANDTVSYSLKSVVLGQNGVWTGPGITDSIFKVNSAGQGNHLIRHEITGRCGDVDMLTIKVKSEVKPLIDSVGPICKGSDPFNLLANPPLGVWEDLGGGNTYISSLGIFNPIDSGYYQFVYSITDPCKASDTVSVIIDNVPTTDFSVTPREGCAPLEVTLTDESSDVSGESLWDFGNNKTLIDSSGTTNQLYSTFGCFDVTLTNSYSNGCSSHKTLLNGVCTYSNPKADFSWSPDILDIDNNQALFDDLSIGNIAGWKWDFSDVVQPSQSSPITTYSIVDPYYENTENPMVVFDSPSGDVINVKLKVTNINGCSDSIIKQVTILDKFSVYLPNAFTPNNDGLNDEFFPVGRNLEFGGNYDFRIFNRWGTLIWMSKTPYQGWDGRVRELSPSSGEIAQEDVYVWRLIVVDPFTGEDYELVGTVTLMQ